jgi:erythronate-4-phosphate dehydrogenase
MLIIGFFVKIIVDENIPAAQHYFAQFGEVTRVNGRQLSKADLADVEVLIVRSVTKVNAALLDGTAVRFVGSTTIGTDHLDTDYLDQVGIKYCNAPGSNAESVVDYVLSAICKIDGFLERLLAGEQVGIIGFGNVGQRLGRRLSALDIPWLAYDPLLARDRHPQLAELSSVLNSSMLSLHAPLTRDGDFPSQHLLSCAQMTKVANSGVILNAGRGEVLASKSLVSLLDTRPDIRLVLDVWENEPLFCPQLAARCLIATPHIAGYSVDGKMTGLTMVAQVLAAYLGQTLAPSSGLEPEKVSLQIPVEDTSSATLIRAAVTAVYDVDEDSQRFKAIIATPDRGKQFDLLRKNYPKRRELGHCQFECDQKAISVLRALQGGTAAEYTV